MVRKYLGDTEDKISSNQEKSLGLSALLSLWVQVELNDEAKRK